MKLDTLISGLENVLKSVDDLLFQSDSVENLEVLLRKFFTNCINENVQLSEKKFRAGSTVVFSGTIIDTSGNTIVFRPEDDKFERIKKFPSPNTRVELKSFLGLVRNFNMWIRNITIFVSRTFKIAI